jgi:cysteinyl-tRNA synthetase
MQIKLFNSEPRKIVDFEPLKDGVVRMYSCGPTVYNIAHIGNMRAFLFADLLQRVLRTVGGYKMQWVMNITNIDDKTIRNSQPESGSWKAEMGIQTQDPKENLRLFTLFYEKEFIDDIAKLGIQAKDFYQMPRATEHIDIMQDLVQRIYKNGYAYVANGSVYFNVGKWSKDDKYGRLFHIDFENFREGVRVDADEYERESASDFVLWKGFKEGEPRWEFILDGESLPGRPGWHLECSAMEHKILGLPFDIHTGGVDLKFPHHEDEIAQSKAGYGIDPTVVFCHNEFLEIEGEKMSKSAGNFYTLRDLIEKGIDPIDIRYSMISAHYRTKLNFTFDGIKAGRKARLRVQEYIYELLDGQFGEDAADIEGLRNAIFTELANDVHTPKALAHLFAFINAHNAKNFTEKANKDLIKLLSELNDIFAAWIFTERAEEVDDIPEEIKKLAEDRFNAKAQKNWELADTLRKEIAEKGYSIKDSRDGYDIIKSE